MQTDLDPRDRALQAHTPAIIVPRFSELAPLEHNGHRYLIAEDGVYLELRRPWMRIVWPVAPAEAPLPFGQAPEIGARLDFDWKQLTALLDPFERDAHLAMPNEFAAWITWKPNGSGGHTLDYRPLLASEATPGGLDLIRPALAEGEHLVADLHSHGAMEAFFSAIDDEDDAGEVKYAAVLGGLGTDAPRWKMRLCLPGGQFVDEDEWAER
ncbi:MAG TPA: PRTRC system protein A [Burkholderiales bacterium]|nr:PRTRC system protein A [Burkholderiales bacterium]